MFDSLVVISFLCSTLVGRAPILTRNQWKLLAQGSFPVLQPTYCLFLSGLHFPHLLTGLSVSKLTEVKINVICGFSFICKVCYPVLKALQVVWTLIASDKAMWAVTQLLVFFQVLTNHLFEYFSTLVLSLISHYPLFLSPPLVFYFFNR